jgi:ornithine cyclodeaminase/alanine dehydrogenase-like protein (mu-crystallin family)
VATVSFYKNAEKELPPGGGVFCVMDAVNGQVKAVMQENRFLTDLRTGAAGAVAIKHLSHPEHTKIGFIGTGQIAKSIARAAAEVRPGLTGFGFAPELCEEFCADMAAELGTSFTVCASAEELCAECDIIITSTPGTKTVLEKAWLKPGTTIVAVGSDQPTKQEIPVDVVVSSKYVCDLVTQTARIGELRSALAEGECDVHAELGEIVNGTKVGREGDEIIVCDLTGTGAQDAAIGGVAWDKLSAL